MSEPETAMHEKLILTCAVTGNLTTREQDPNLPVPPEKIAEVALDAATITFGREIVINTLGNVNPMESLGATLASRREAQPMLGVSR